MKKTPPADSPLYGEDAYSCVTEAARRRYRAGLCYLQPSPGELILDIACGRGEMVARCQELGANAIGIDYSQTAVEISKETVKEGVIIRASATHLPFPNETFDKVVTFDVLEHLDTEDTLKYLNEIRRVLKRGGMLLLHTPNRWDKLRETLLWIPNLIYNLLFPETKFDPRRRRHLEEVHINVQSPLSLRRLLQGERFNAKIWFGGPRRDETVFWKFIIYKTLFFTSSLWAKAYRQDVRPTK